MKLSEMIKQAQEQLAKHGDHDVLDEHDDLLTGVSIRTITPEQAAFWSWPENAGKHYYVMGTDD